MLSGGELAKIPGSLMLPITAGMITLAYNIPGVNVEIKLPRDVYVDIFVRKIRKWDDARIAAANPGIAFPHRDIALVVRQDSSGTTAAFTNHLATIGSSWRDAGMDVGKFIEWPGAVLSAPGNEGVAARIRLSEGSIGYVEYWFAQRLGLRMAALQNKAGSFITPTAHAGELALSGRVAQVQELAASVADPSGADAYPLVSYSWMLAYAQYADPAKATVLREFAGWSTVRSRTGLRRAARLSAAFVRCTQHQPASTRELNLIISPWTSACLRSRYDGVLWRERRNWRLFSSMLRQEPFRC